MEVRTDGGGNTNGNVGASIGLRNQWCSLMGGGKPVRKVLSGRVFRFRETLLCFLQSVALSSLRRSELEYFII